MTTARADQRKMSEYLCFDIGGTAIKYGIVTSEEVFVMKDQTATHSERGGPAIVSRVEEIASDIFSKGYQIEGICLSTAGMVDPSEGKIIHANDNIPDYTGVEWKRSLEQRFRMPCSVENDVYCAGLAEYGSGAAAGKNPVLCLTIGTGVGGCIIIDGKVLHGCGCSAGSVGYLKFGSATFESDCSTAALVRRVTARKQAGMRTGSGQSPFEPRGAWDGKRIFEGILKEDAVCVEEVDRMCENIGAGLANLCYIINPEMVVLGGGIMAQANYLLPRIRCAMDRNLVPAVRNRTEIRPAVHQNQAGMLGAFYHFREERLTV